MRRARMLFALMLVVTCLELGKAQAVAAGGSANGPVLEAYGARAVRRNRSVLFHLSSKHKALKRLEDESGGGWFVFWDAQTRVPLRIFGHGLEAPGSVRSAAEAESFSLSVIERYADLLAPGGSHTDFLLVSNLLFDKVRTVGFHQYRNGFRVLTGQLGFVFKHDRLVVMASEALPHVEARSGGPWINRATAVKSASQWIAGDLESAVSVEDVDGPFILPLLFEERALGGISYRTVFAATVRCLDRLCLFEVYIDCSTGEPVARKNLMRFGAASLRYNAPIRWPGGGRMDYPAAFVDLAVDGASATSDASGVFTWTGTDPVPVTVRAGGPYAEVINEAGVGASSVFSLQDAGHATWDASSEELIDAQLSAFVHAFVAKEFARKLNPFLSWIDDCMEINVNIDDSCNAASDGFSLYFMQASQQCENTARLADVIYHEFGHSLHYQSIIPGIGAFDESLSEGIADFYSASITGDPGMGRGFFYDDEPLRQIDPPGWEHVWPDDISYDSHETGLILSGALWDLRKELLAELGEEEGIELMNRLYYSVVQRASDIPSSYVEALVGDDDDGDLENGTPHICAIQRSFGLHGLTGTDSLFGGLLIRPPEINGLQVRVEISDPGFGCETASLSSASMEWQRRDDPSQAGVVELVSEGGGYYRGDIPEQPDGVVVNVRITIELDSGEVVVFPENPADPMYDVFVGEVVVLYCTDFEQDPETEGWTHGLSSGSAGEGADDWHWGPPRADSTSGDPSEAYSGTRVFGNDLGGGNYNGMYQPNKTNFAKSPVIDTGGYTNIRLQYRRWLTVEDGFFDRATIYANEEPAWSNFNSNQGDYSNVHHRDKEWRFCDLDLTSFVQDKKIQVKYELASDPGLELGGWTIDDFCVVAFVPPYCGDGRVGEDEECDDGGQNSDLLPDACRTDCRLARCGDGVVDRDEECDDGALNDDQEPEACRTDCRPARCGDGVVDQGEQCDDGNTDDGDGCSGSCVNESTKRGCGCRVGSSVQAGSGTGGSSFLVFLAFALLLFCACRSNGS